VDITVPAEEGALLAWLHANAEIITRDTDDTGATRCRIRIDGLRKGRLLGRLARAGLAPVRPA
jgi:GTPase